MALESYTKLYKKRYLFNMAAVIICMVLCLSAFLIEFHISSTNAHNPKTINGSSDLKKASSNNIYAKLKTKHIYNLSFEMDNYKIYGILFDGKIVTLVVTQVSDAKVIKSTDGIYSVSGEIQTYSDEEYKNLKRGLKAKGFSETQLNSLLSKNYLKFVSPYHNLYTRLPIEIIVLLILFFRSMKYLWTNRRVCLSTQIYSKGKIKAFYSNVDEELTRPDVLTKGIFTITQKYIIVNSNKIVFAFPIKEVVWIFKKNKSRFLWNKQDIVFIFSTGEQYKVPIYKKYADFTDEVIKLVSSVSPTTFTGTSEEHYILYKKHRREFMKYWVRRTQEEKAK
ncbi:hypothetical protein [Clostridium oryzae]|uniref:Uncharacterized protein n=1 Tax=Clostridium oryzae TaxID=1450648 RepID=A0A1V4IS39_9CLOT|nr:hypothetical protein [Clostridium oryzae]OPJ62851.1 hypothetical protein CLORY_14750 [Clostridium oryzae]